MSQDHVDLAAADGELDRPMSIAMLRPGIGDHSRGTASDGLPPDGLTCQLFVSGGVAPTGRSGMSQ